MSHHICLDTIYAIDTHSRAPAGNHYTAAPQRDTRSLAARASNHSQQHPSHLYRPQPSRAGAESFIRCMDFFLDSLNNAGLGVHCVHFASTVVTPHFCNLLCRVRGGSAGAAWRGRGRGGGAMLGHISWLVTRGGAAVGGAGGGVVPRTGRRGPAAAVRDRVRTALRPHHTLPGEAPWPGHQSIPRPSSLTVAGAGPGQQPVCGTTALDRWVRRVTELLATGAPAPQSVWLSLAAVWTTVSISLLLCQLCYAIPLKFKDSVKYR